MEKQAQFGQWFQCTLDNGAIEFVPAEFGSLSGVEPDIDYYPFSPGFTDIVRLLRLYTSSEPVRVLLRNGWGVRWYDTEGMNDSPWFVFSTKEAAEQVLDQMDQMS